MLSASTQIHLRGSALASMSAASCSASSALFAFTRQTEKGMEVMAASAAMPSA